MHHKKLPKNKWGQYECYLAQYSNGIYSNSCLFSTLEAGMFFVVTGLGSEVDWTTFPNLDLKYPFNEADGSDLNRTPQFEVVREFNGRKIIGSVARRGISDDWTVGNGIAERSKVYYEQATGRDDVKISGYGQSLKAEVK